MRKLWLAVAIGAAATLSSIGAANAAAAEFGNDCEPTAAPPNTAFVQIGNAPGSPLPAAAPTSGVLTKWKVNFPAIPPAAQTLKIFRKAPVAGEYTVVAEAPGQIVGGKNILDVRIPVKAGDLLGLYGNTPIGGLVCAGGSGAAFGQFLGEPLLSSTHPFTEGTGARVDVAAVVEPDADGDGFGDETQDKCPRSAALQIECPVVALEAFTVVGKGSVLVLVSTSSSAPVTVSGTVKIGKGRQAGLSAAGQTVVPGKLGKFKLEFSKKLKSRLHELGSKQSLKLNVRATATDLAGVVTQSSAKAKLPGQG